MLLKLALDSKVLEILNSVQCTIVFLRVSIPVRETLSILGREALNDKEGKAPSAEKNNVFDTGTNISVFSAVTQAAQHFGAERLSTSVV